MKTFKILLMALVLSLVCSMAHADPSVKRTKNTFVIEEAVNAEILSQIKAEMGEVEQDYLTFVLKKITNEDLDALCKAYPAMDALTISDSKELNSLAPLANLKGLRGIKLGDVAVEDLSPLAGLVEMMKLDLSCKQMGPDLKWMSGMSKLTSIDIAAGKSLVSFEGIPSLPNLKTIRISAAAPADLAPLSALPALTRVDLTNCVLSDLTPLAELNSLVDLSLYGATVKDFGPLSKSPKLKKLMYYATKEADYSTLGQLTQVEELSGGLTNLDDISWVANLPNLKKLSVFAEKITNYTPLAQAKVEDLQIWNMKAPVDLNQLSGAVSLTKVKLWSLKELTGFEALGALVNLKELVLDGATETEGSVADLSFLGSLTHLEQLTIKKTNVKNFEAIAKCSKLTSVELDKNTTGITSLAALKELPALTKLVVGKDTFSEAELEGLGDKVKITQR